MQMDFSVRFYDSKTKNLFVTFYSYSISYIKYKQNIETGETLAHDLCERLNSSKNIGISLLTLRQVSFGLADQHLHGINFDDSL